MSYEHMVAGLLGGITSTLVLHPLDLLKVRFAVSDGRSSLKKSYKNVTNAFTTIIKDEGVRGLYKGVAPNCIGSGSAWGLYFLLYNSIKKQMSEKTGQQQLGLLSHMTAGMCAGVLTTTFTNPIWVVKTRLCLQYTTQTELIKDPDKSKLLPESRRYTGTWDALKKLYKYEGVAGLYRGYVPGLLGVSHGALQLSAYEELKRIYIKKYNLPEDHSLGTIQYMACATASKLLAATVTYPYQVVRARLQDQHVAYEGTMDVVKKTWRNEKYAGFYKGFSAYFLHVMPNVCIVFLVYESVSKWLK